MCVGLINMVIPNGSQILLVMASKVSSSAHQAAWVQARAEDIVNVFLGKTVYSTSASLHP